MVSDVTKLADWLKADAAPAGSSVAAADYCSTDRTHGTFRAEGSRSNRISMLRSCIHV